MSFDNRTIFAPSTPVGESGITVIRVSGEKALPALSCIFTKKANKFEPIDFASAVSHTAIHGYLRDGSDIIDEVIVTIFRSPNSYTGEDVVEISSHGGSYIFRKINKLLVSNGIEHAQPGEFSKRAFLNGKMDLAQAEAVADLIRAKTDLSNKLAMKQLLGEFSGKIKELKEELINYCSLLELELDFSEEGLDLVSRKDLLEKIGGLILKFNNLTRSFESGKIITGGVNLAIVGKPNVGKSSIFNYLLKESRAIVSEIPGTTRDYLQEPLIMGGVVFNLIDTAGIRASSDAIEQEGVKRTRQKISESDIVVEVEDLSNPNSDGTEYIMGIAETKIVRAYNKVDVAPVSTAKGLVISALDGTNMSMLQEEIVRKAKALIRDDEPSDVIVTNQRHRDCLLKSCEYLVNAESQIESGGGNELISYEIRSAMDSLTEIIGKTSNVDILNNIFSKFCIGK